MGLIKNLREMEAKRCPILGVQHAEGIIAGEAADALEAMGWQPIETAPKDGTIVDLLHKDGFRLIDQWWDDEDQSWAAALFRGDDITHWMPLPEPPA